jgi:hypothetical protein
MVAAKSRKNGCFLAANHLRLKGSLRVHQEPHCFLEIINLPAQGDPS